MTNDALLMFEHAAHLFALAQAGGLAPQLTKGVEFSAPHPAGAHHVDMIDHGRVERENALNSLAKTDLPNGDGFAQAGILAGNHGSFKCLKAFFITFFNLDVHADGVAGAKRRAFWLLVFGDYFGEERVRHGYNSLNS